jgi:hypothetical protein
VSAGERKNKKISLGANMDISSTRARLAARSIVAAAAFGLATAAGAQELEYRASVGAGYTDNVRRDPINETNESLALANLRFSYNANTRHVQADVLGDVAYTKYLSDTYDPELLGNAYGDASFSIVPERFIWLLTDGFGQVLQDPFQPPTPNNNQNINYLTTGPDVYVGLGSQMRLRVGGRYSLATYEDDPFDSTTLGGEIGLLREISDRSVISFNGRIQDIKYAEESLDADFQQSDIYLRYESQGARTNLAVDAGYGVLDPESSTENDSGPRFQVDMSRLISESSILTFMGSRRFATAASDFANNLGQGNLGLSTAQGQQTFEPYTLDEARLGWTYSRHRTTLSAYGDWSRREYESDSTLNLTLVSFALHATRDLSPTTSLDFSTQFTSSKYQPPSPDFDELTAGLGFVWRLSRSVVLEADYDFYNRKSDTTGGKILENRLMLTLGFGRGEPRRNRVAPHFGIESLPGAGN